MLSKGGEKITGNMEEEVKGGRRRRGECLSHHITLSPGLWCNFLREWVPNRAVVCVVAWVAMC